MSKKFLIVLLLTLILPFILGETPIGNIFMSTICAAESTRNGNACETRPANCPTGYTNLQEASLQFRGMNFADLTVSIADTYPGKVPADMCIPQNLTNIVEIWVGDEEKGTQGAKYLEEYEYRGDGVGSNNINFIPKACPQGWTMQQAPKGFPVIGWSRPYGCCPTGYTFVTNASQSNPLASQGGICCARGRGGETATHWKVEPDRGCAFDAGNDVADVSPWGGAAAGTFSGSLNDLNNAIANGRGPRSFKEVSGGPVNFPQLGLPLGPASEFAIIEGTRTFAPKSCPSRASCAITTKNDIDSVVNARIFDTDPSAVCVSCYNAGAAIGTLTDDDPNTQDFVRYCDPSSANFYRDERLIGSPDITDGYLLEEGQNQQFYEDCFESGGIYTAIGCVDPSPTGIITGLIRIALGIMGGVALLQLVYVGLLYQQGQTEKIKSARNQVIATLTGIAVLVFSVLILRIIGVNILDVIPSGSF